MIKRNGGSGDENGLGGNDSRNRACTAFDCFYEAKGNHFLIQIVCGFIVKFETYDYVITEEKFSTCSAWLESEDDEVVARVDRRIGAVTGLEMSTAEPLQVKLYYRYPLFRT